MKRLTSTLFICLSTIFTLGVLAQDYHNERGFLGVYSENVSREKAKILGFENYYGSYVTQVLENTAAEKFGIKPFDYITGISGEEVSADRGLTQLLRNHKPGDKVKIEFIRQGKSMTKQVTLGRQSDARQSYSDKEKRAFFGIRQEHSDLPKGVYGVPVTIVKNSTAEAMGLEDEDIITAINGNRIVDWHDITTAIQNLEPGDNIQVDYFRDGETLKANRPILSYEETYSSKYRGGVETDESINESPASRFGEDGYDMMPPFRDVSNMKVDIEDMTKEEAGEMKSNYNIDMPVSNNLRIEDLDIYPNPSTGMFNLSFDLPARGDLAIRICNSSGRLIYESDLMDYSGRFEEEIDISQNGPGAYFLMIQQGRQSMAKKVVVSMK